MRRRFALGAEQVGEGAGVEDVVEPAIKLLDRGRGDARAGPGRQWTETAGREAADVDLVLRTLVVIGVLLALGRAHEESPRWQPVRALALAPVPEPIAKSVGGSGRHPHVPHQNADHRPEYQNMNPNWATHLTRHGAGIADDGRATPPADAASTDTADCTRCDLSHLGLIGVSGADAEPFLQGQLTNDVCAVTTGSAQLAGWCSPKGRLLALFRVLRSPEGLWLQLPRERLPEVLKRLRMYVLRSKVILDDLSDGPVPVGLAGPGAAAVLARLGLPVPNPDHGQAAADGVTLIGVPGPVSRYLLLGDSARQQSLWDALAPSCAWADAHTWTLGDIRAGLPTVYTSTADAFVPQMVNLDLLGGVSFTKGCYTGQEVVARMQYLGRLKRRMYVGALESGAAPRPGDPLWSPASTSEQGAGTIVEAAPAGPGRFAVLAVVETAAADGDGVRLGDGGSPLRLEPPPYGFP